MYKPALAFSTEIPPTHQKREEKKPSFKKKKKKKDLDKYSSVRHCCNEQFSSSAFLKYCSRAIVTVCSSGHAMK